MIKFIPQICLCQPCVGLPCKDQDGVYISLLMGKTGFVRREASPKEVLAHCLRLAQEVAPPTPKGKRGCPWRYGYDLCLALRFGAPTPNEPQTPLPPSTLPSPNRT
jgi:hypothetical protein